jgi:phospholipase A1
MKRASVLLALACLGIKAFAEEPGSVNCRHASPSYARYWELDDATDCGPFNIRGYKPTSLDWVYADRVNKAPQSDNPSRDATDAQPYMQGELRIQLSIRTKLASNLWPWLPAGQHDSIWFGYTQQSYWQLFNGPLSRPFRTTDHEPELIYMAPTPVDLPWGWRVSYTGFALNHQSDGQGLPLSRSWNRVILMSGMEHADGYNLSARLWQRLTDGDDRSSTDLAAQDDNPHIEETYGRAEIAGSMRVGRDNTLSLTVRTNLRDTQGGSWRLEWLSPFDSQSPGLRFHVQVFSGYGDSITDYNYRRTVYSMGLSLVDW